MAATATSLPVATAATTKAEPASAAKASDFSWDNASVYFLLTDRFNNGNTSNDHSYNRGLNEDGSVTDKMKSNAAMFRGGDFAGITEKLTEGYFDKLGVTALWISAPYEQILGYCCGGGGKMAIPHYAYHGYYAGDYSNFDKNFGTEAEFKTMVETAHQKGIRIVLDVVMNHPGYNTMYDMNELGFGMLKDGWKDEYYAYKGNEETYHNFIEYDEAGKNADAKSLWANWWGVDWLRAGISGYEGFNGISSSDAERYSAGGFLPDFKTESTAEVGLPTFLKNKWEKEGNYQQKTADMDNWFTSTGNTKRVRNYIVYWLSRFVENYGVDGFRCDTAKHVEADSWAALKTECVKALNTWRANNPDNVAAGWTDDFWMTAEVFGKSISGPSDVYFKDAKFDSTINFEFGGKGVTAVDKVNDTYEKYSDNIIGKDGYNVLTYISSHDTDLCGRDVNAGDSDIDKLIYQGSALQLMPGAIQIYYGDETDRKYVYSGNSTLIRNIRSGDHDVRSYMNWDSVNNDLLEHWQKVGTFRKAHIAVGAGVHHSLSATSGAAFQRTYSKDGLEDKVICCIGANANTDVTINVNSDVAEGTVLVNKYDNKTATVKGGSVTFNSGKNGTILAEKADTISVSKVKLSANKKTINVGQSFNLKATVSPSNATNKAVKWATSKKSVATVSASGKVTAKAKGSANITATAKDGSKKSAKCVVTVKQPVKKITAPKSVKIKKGASKKVKITVSPSNANNTACTLKASNKNIKLSAKTIKKSATVKITGVKKGSSKVTVTAKDGSKKKAVIKVKVK